MARFTAPATSVLPEAHRELHEDSVRGAGVSLLPQALAPGNQADGMGQWGRLRRFLVGFCQAFQAETERKDLPSRAR